MTERSIYEGIRIESEVFINDIKEVEEKFRHPKKRTKKNKEE